MIMLALSGVVMILSGVAVAMAGSAAGVPVGIVTGVVMVMSGVGMLVLAKLLAPVMQWPQQESLSRSNPTIHRSSGSFG